MPNVQYYTCRNGIDLINGSASWGADEVWVLDRIEGTYTNPVYADPSNITERGAFNPRVAFRTSDVTIGELPSATRTTQNRIELVTDRAGIECVRQRDSLYAWSPERARSQGRRYETFHVSSQHIIRESNGEYVIARHHDGEVGSLPTSTTTGERVSEYSQLLNAMIDRINKDGLTV